jgi:ribosome-binding protein aMBF1 (putative translation factor)
LKQNVQAVGDWIRVKRIERNLTRGHLAAKMGIAHTLIRSWEGCTSWPGKEQIHDLIMVFEAAPPLGIVY